MFNDFQFNKSKPEAPQKALPSFKAGDIQPAPCWCLVEQVLPEPDPDDDSRIITKGSVRTPDGQKVVIAMGKARNKEQAADAMMMETWRIIATGSDWFLDGGEQVPFIFKPGDECIISGHGAQTAHGLQYPDDKGLEDERPTRFLVQMCFVLGRVTRDEHLGEVHGDG